MASQETSLIFGELKKGIRGSPTRGTRRRRNKHSRCIALSLDSASIKGYPWSEKINSLRSRTRMKRLLNYQ